MLCTSSVMLCDDMSLCHVVWWCLHLCHVVWWCECVFVMLCTSSVMLCGVMSVCHVMWCHVCLSCCVVTSASLSCCVVMLCVSLSCCVHLLSCCVVSCMSVMLCGDVVVVVSTPSRAWARTGSQTPAQLLPHTSSSAVTPTGPVHKSQTVSVVGMSGQLKRCNESWFGSLQSGQFAAGWLAGSILCM